MARSSSKANAGTLKRLRRDVRGVAYVEFLISFFPVFLLFMGTVQLAFIHSARLVVQHAAYRGARSAIVVLSDSPKRFDGAPRGDTEFGASEGPGEFLQTVFSALELDMSGAPQQDIASTGGTRMNAIRRSAYIPLSSIAPPVAWFRASLGASAVSLYDSLAPSGLASTARFAFGFLAYNPGAAVVTLRQEPGSSELAPSMIGSKDDVTVHVTYLYYCSVPLVSALICDSVGDLTAWGLAAAEIEGLYNEFDAGNYGEVADRLWNAEERLEPSEAQTTLREELKRAEYPALLLPLLMTHARFAVIQAEVTLPNQGAAYEDVPGEG